MTILPKKKTATASKSENINSENDSHHGGGYQMGIASNQSNDELLFVTSNVPTDPRWGVSRTESRPSASSPSHWSASASVVSRDEKRHASSPIHPADFEDSLDGAPSAKRARQALTSRHVRARSKPYVPTPSSSRVQTPPPVDDDTGYNSEDEYSHVGVTLTEEEWLEKERRFERTMRRQGYSIKQMGEDGACLFRAVADQLYGDQEMHRCVRSQCLDYVESNRDYFEQYVTEDFVDYVRRKRLIQVHGNHLEIQALSELYNRPIHIYCYSAEPINIFQNVSRSTSEISVPIRISYHKGVHYNSLIDPNNPTIGLGLGLPGVKLGCDKSDLRAMLAQNDNNLTEKQMLQDKMHFTDWEATNEVIEEQVARESYLLWIQEQEKARNKSNRNPPAATVTSGQMSPRAGSGCSSPRPLGGGGSSSPRPLGSPRPRSSGHNSPRSPSGQGAVCAGPSSAGGHTTPPRPASGHTSPKAGCSSQPDGAVAVNGESSGSPRPCSSKSSAGAPVQAQSAVDHGLGPGFHLRETATFLNGVPSEFFDYDDDWGSESVLNQVLAESQQEYFNSLKRQAGQSDNQQEQE